MKKSLMILASVALGASLATAEDVTSKNVVGFQTFSMTNGQLKQQGLQFEKIGSGTNKLIDLSFDPAMWNGTIIQVAYIQGALVKFKTYKMWEFDPNEDEGPSGWYQGLSYVGDTVTIPTGTGFWLDPKTNADHTFSGEVVSDDIQFAFEQGKSQMICIPYPVDVKLQDLPFTSEKWDKTEIQVAYNQGALVKFKTYKMWKSDPNEDEGPSGWYQGLSYVGATVTIPAGQGFWITSQTNSTITFTSPL